MFDAHKIKDEVVLWIRNFFLENGPNCNAVIGISGGKDSSIVAALLVEALGKERVIGVLMPNGEQADIQDSYDVCKLLDIKHYVINIKDAYDGAIKQIEKVCPLTEQAIINLPPRLRMSTLYAVTSDIAVSSLSILSCSAAICLC